MRWLFWVTPPADGASNMALDEALMHSAGRTGVAVFRLYSWSVPTLSLGRNQRARGCYDLTVSDSLGIGFVRRPTGGRALLHHHEVTYSVTMPLADAQGSRPEYHFINRVLLGGLTLLGVPAQLASQTKSLKPGLRPCFDVPAEHEIAVSGRKLVGSAQWRRGGALLQHGSILVRDDQPLIARLLTEPSEAIPAAATLADALGFEPSLDQVADVIQQSLKELTGGGQCTEPFIRDTELEADLVELHRTYSAADWTWRR